MCTKARQSGMSMIELIMFIIIVSVAVVGILSVMTYTSRHSSDPLVRKKAVAAAESLLEEVFLQAFTYCDPSDANAETADGPVSPPAAIGCAAAANNETSLAPEAGETRYSNLVPFDNVGDYNGFTMAAGIIGIDNTPIAELANYNANVTVSAVGAAMGLADNTAALKIDVRITGEGEDVTISAYRFRYAPNMP